jgi:hypothetical protein
MDGWSVLSVTRHAPTGVKPRSQCTVRWPDKHTETETCSRRDGLRRREYFAKVVSESATCEPSASARSFHFLQCRTWGAIRQLFPLTPPRRAVLGNDRSSETPGPVTPRRKPLCWNSLLACSYLCSSRGAKPVSQLLINLFSFFNLPVQVPCAEPVGYPHLLPQSGDAVTPREVPCWIAGDLRDAS